MTTDMIPSIFLGLGTLLFCIGIGGGIHTHLWLKEAQGVDGVVTALIAKTGRSDGKKSTTYSPKVAYQWNNESKEFVGSMSSSPPDFYVGEIVRVAIHERKDKQCIATFGQLYGPALITLLIGACLLIGIGMFMKGKAILAYLYPHLQ